MTISHDSFFFIHPAGRLHAQLAGKKLYCPQPTFANAFRRKFDRGKMLSHFSLGLIDIIIGGVLLSHLVISMMILPCILGAWFLIRSISQFVIAVSNRQKIWVFLGGMATLLLALFILFNPALGAMTIVAWSAMAFIVTGLYYGLLAFRMKEVYEGFRHRLS